MGQPFWVRLLSRGLGQYIPALFALLFLLLSFTPFRFPLLNGTSYAALTICFYYWTLFRPAQMPVWFVFILGILYDVINGLPVGISAFAWLLMCGIILRYNRMFAIGAFWGIWAAYAIVLGIAMVTEWAMLSYVRGQLQPLQSIVQFWMASSLVYPLLHHVFSFFVPMSDSDRWHSHR